MSVFSIIMNDGVYDKLGDINSKAHLLSMGGELNDSLFSLASGGADLQTQYLELLTEKQNSKAIFSDKGRLSNTKNAEIYFNNRDIIDAKLREITAEIEEKVEKAGTIKQLLNYFENIALALQGNNKNK